jgi:acyl-CoA synthetase (AMP-forming)/AMP-acid ligase II
MIERFNIVDLFSDATERNPNKTAIIYKNGKISFREFEKQVTHTAHYLINKGIGKNDRVLVFVPMSIDLYRIVLALFKIGAAAVFLDEWVSKKRMEECCKVAQCKAFIGILKAQIFALFLTELQKIPIRLGTAYSTDHSSNTFPVTFKGDTALITFTTGTTGTPKAAKRTHGFLYNQFKALKEKIEPEEHDITMAVLPIVLLINLATGTTSVIADFKGSKPNSLKPGKIIQQLKKFGVNSIIASPFFVRKISECIIHNSVSIPFMKKIFTGGAPVFPAEAAIYDKAFPEVKVEVVYGSTEAEPISSINIKKLIKEKNNIFQGLNVGKPDDGTTVKIIQIIDDDIRVKSENELAAIELPIKEVGEIIVSGDHILREYYNNEEALNRNKIFIEKICWHRTGDSGYLDENGMLFLTGRCNTLIYKNGKAVYPFVYENYFQSIMGVETGTVILLKEKITAVIELKDELQREAVRSNIKKLGQTFEKIIFLKKIPRDPRHNSKIDYQKLRLLLINSKDQV